MWIFVQDHEAYDDYMQLLQDDLEMRFPEEDVSDMIASLNELADMQPGITMQYSCTDRPLCFCMSR